MAMPRSGGSASLTSTPSIRIRPELIDSNPAMMRSKVDLPQPDGPTNTQNSPSSMVSESRGITDKLLADYPNLFGDCSANSGNNLLSRDPSFTPDFVKRHQDKLLMGSDCGCTDGHGAGVSQAGNPAAARLSGKCVARETLTVLKTSASPEIFHKIVWANAHTLLKIPA